MLVVSIGQTDSKLSSRFKSIVQKQTSISKLIITAAAFIFVLVSSTSFEGQRRTAPAAAPNVASYLPPSDAVAVVDVKRMLNETMPSILGSDKAKLADANAQVEKFKTRTGIDLHSIDGFTVGIRYTYPNGASTKLEIVAIAHGTFDARAVAASARGAANGKSREEKYRGASITIVPVNDDIKLLGLWNMRVNDLAICVLDANSLALGTPENVRAAIDAGKAGRAPADLVALATKDQTAVLGFGANMTRELLAKLDVGNDTIAKDVGAIKQAYGSLSSTQGNVTMMIVARTDTVDAAKNLGDTVEGLKQLGGIFIMRMAEPRKTLAESALNNLKIAARGTELEIRTQVTAASLAALVK
jgi:hypothetical protein